MLKKAHVFKFFVYLKSERIQEWRCALHPLLVDLNPKVLGRRSSDRPVPSAWLGFCRSSLCLMVGPVVFYWTCQGGDLSASRGRKRDVHESHQSSGSGLQPGSILYFSVYPRGVSLETFSTRYYLITGPGLCDQNREDAPLLDEALSSKLLVEWKRVPTRIRPFCDCFVSQSFISTRFFVFLSLQKKKIRREIVVKCCWLIYKCDILQPKCLSSKINI